MSSSLDAEALARALEEADVRILLMVLFHLTGDERWLEPPYRPARDVRLVADPGAGLDEGIRAEIRAAAHAAIVERLDRPEVPVPGDELLQRMMSVCLGERVRPEYVPMMQREMGFVDDGLPDLRASWGGRAPTVVVVGTGVSGIAAAARLGAAGAECTVVEKNDDIGGTWLENTYPDCGVDTPNHFYSYSFFPNPEWTHYFALRDEIHAYLRRCVDALGIRPRIRFGTTVTAAEWVEARQQWSVRGHTRDGAAFELDADVLVAAAGQLNRPKHPDLDGLDAFAGTYFHSAEWRHDVELRGRRVGVVGTGASAMQFVPKIASDVAHLTVFQRSPQWARPIDDYRSEVPAGVRWLIRHVPFYGPWLRCCLAWRYGDGLHRRIQRDDEWPHQDRALNEANDRDRAELTAYIEAQLDGRPDLVAKALPDYPPYGKRMLIDNGWYQALRRPNVELVTEPVERVEPAGVRTADGRLHEVDVLVAATGFLAHDLLGHVDVRGRHGTLRQRWGADDARAHLGITVPGFPNLFVLYGPNTNLAHGGSIIFHAECQVRYVVDLLDRMGRCGATAADVKEAVHDAYNDAVDAAHDRMVWTHPRVRTWYRNRAGRVVSNSPWRLVDYWGMTRQADLADYELSFGAGPVAAGPAVAHGAAGGGA